MASIKVKFRESTVDGKEGTVFYQIIHERVVKLINTSYHLTSDEWDFKHSIPRMLSNEPHPTVTKIAERIRYDRKRLVRIINIFDQKYIAYTSADIVEEYQRLMSHYSLFHFMTNIIFQLRDRGQIRTAETYSSTLKIFMDFRNDEDIMIDCITTEVIESFETYLRNKGLIPNTISFYMRILRAVYNRAVEQGAVEQSHPFRHVYTGVDKTVKRALPVNAIRSIRRLDLTRNPALDFARDIFILSFIFRGMSFVDMAYLQKSDLKNGQLTYRRRKTGQRLTIKWTSEMQDIVDKYPENKSKYLLPIIRKPDTYQRERSAYRNMCHKINHNLKTLAKMAGVTIPLTLYVARHSWASIARAKGIPVSIISEGMGHESEMTTQIYLASLDASAVDKANSLILSSI